MHGYKEVPTEQRYKASSPTFPGKSAREAASLKCLYSVTHAAWEQRGGTGGLCVAERLRSNLCHGDSSVTGVLPWMDTGSLSRTNRDG